MCANSKSDGEEPAQPTADLLEEAPGAPGCWKARHGACQPGPFPSPAGPRACCARAAESQVLPCLCRNRRVMKAWGAHCPHLGGVSQGQGHPWPSTGELRSWPKSSRSRQNGERKVIQVQFLFNTQPHLPLKYRTKSCP